MCGYLSFPNPETTVPMLMLNLPLEVTNEAIAVVSLYTKAYTELDPGERSSLICCEAFVFISSLRELKRVRE